MENDKEKEREAKRMRADRVRAKTERKDREKEMAKNRAILKRFDDLHERGQKRKLDEAAWNNCPQSGSAENPIELMDYEQSSNGDSGEGPLSVLERQGPSNAMLPIALVPIMENDRLQEFQLRALELMQANPAPPAYPMSFMKGKANELGFEKYMNSVYIERADKMLSEIREYKQGLQIRNHVIDMELSAAAPHGIFPELPVTLIQTLTATSSYEEPD